MAFIWEEAYFRYSKYKYFLPTYMAKLFKQKIINQRLQDFKIPDMESKLEILRSWHKASQIGNLKEKSEREVEQSFWENILGNVLGYTAYGNADIYMREPQPKAEWTGQKADFWLGYFDSSGEKNNLVKVVMEVKDARTSLDKPQQREWSLTPVQQWFKYKPFFKSCDFVLVSNFVETRLFYDNYSDYESWTLSDLVNPKDNYFAFRKFYYLLCSDNLIARRGESTTKKLLSDIRIEQESITKKFYKEYSWLRKELFKDIVANNWWKWSGLQLDFALNKTQKIIDRIIFIHFCEDIGLIPNGKLWEKVEKAEKLWFAPWEMVKKFFEFVDIWHEDLQNPWGYNGWLFREDSELNALKVGDDICKKFVDLGRYDFEDDLSVNILGHIFEQSISDIEDMKEQIQTSPLTPLLSGEGSWKVSKRKKDGVFYTPEYIVDYIVRNSVGKKIDDWEMELKEKHKFKEDLTDKNYTKRAIAVYEDLQEKLQTITVLDPACGSWAFLVKVFDFLLEKNKEIAKTLEDLWKRQWLFSSDAYFKSILQNNIYWVDLNEESVEITKLSLWLKTAQKGKKLANLDKNIKCGNSLIDDPAIAWDKAFDWETEFPEIFADWGFDVVVGNPPYVTTSLWKWFSSEEEITKFYKQKYKLSSAYKVNLYLMFLELWTNLLNKKGYISYIIPNTIYLNYFYSDFRRYLIDNFYLKTLFNLEYEVFEDADIWGLAILVIQNDITSDTSLRNAKSLDEFNVPIETLIKQERFLTIPDNKFIFSIDLIELWNKAYINSITFWGWDFQFYNWIKSWNNKKFLSINKESEIHKKVIRWRDFYKYTPLNFNFYIKYIPEELWSNTNSEMYYVDEKLIFRQTSDHLVASYDNQKYLTMDTTHLCFPLNDSFKVKFLLVIMNSRLLNFLYQIIVPEIWKTFSEVKIVNLKKLPIKNIPLSEQTPFIEKADFMLEHNKIMWEKVQKFLSRVQWTFELEKLSKKLQKFYELTFEEFLKELKKKKVVLSLKDQDEWQDYFDSYKKEVSEIKAEIDACDREIDEMVFDLYGLSEEERGVVLAS